MQELNVNEMEVVSGGYRQFRGKSGWLLVGQLFSWGAAQNWGSSRHNWNTNIAP